MPEKSCSKYEFTKAMKLGRLIHCGPKHPKQAPAKMLPDEKH
jgi:hypothetical protein